MLSFLRLDSCCSTCIDCSARSFALNTADAPYSTDMHANMLVKTARQDVPTIIVIVVSHITVGPKAAC